VSDKPYGYSVEWKLIVTHPERRDASFLPVPTGHTIVNRSFHPTRAGAIREFESILRGDYDYISEYMSRVSVLALYNWCSPKFVRRPIDRPVPEKAS